MSVNTSVYGSKESWLGISTNSTIKLANFGDNVGTIAKGFSSGKLKLNKAFDNSIVHSALGNESAISRMRTFQGATELDSDNFEQTLWSFATGNDHFYEIDGTWTNNTYNMLTPVTNNDVKNSVAIPVVNFRYDSIRALITVECSPSVDGKVITTSLHDYVTNYKTTHPKIIHVYMNLYERKEGTWTPLNVQGNKGLFVWNPSKYFAHTHMTGKTFTDGQIGRPICVDWGRNTNKNTIVLLGKFNEGNSSLPRTDLNLISGDWEVENISGKGYFYKDYFEGFEEYCMHQCACFGIQFVIDSEYVDVDIDNPETPSEDIENVYIGVLDESYVGHGDFVKGEKIFETDQYDKEAEEIDFNPNIESADFGDLETDSHNIVGGSGGHTIYNMTESNMAMLIKFANSEESGETGQNFMNYITSVKYCPFGFHTRGADETVKLNGHLVNVGSVAVTGNKGYRQDTFTSNTITISRFFRDFRDFEPYTTISLKLPFSDTVNLPCAEWYGHNLHVVFSVDEISGTGVAKVYKDDLIWLTVNCSMAIDVPLTTLNSGSYHNALIQAKTTRNSALLGIGLSAVGVGANISKGDVLGTTMSTGGLIGSLESYRQSEYNLTHLTKPISHIGGTGDMTNFTMSWYPQIVYERCDKLSNKKSDRYYFDFDNYAQTVGYACCRPSTLNSETGFVVCNNIDLSGCTLTESEKTEITSLVTSGIIV